MTGTELLFALGVLAGLYIAYRKFGRKSAPKGDITPSPRPDDYEPDKYRKDKYL
jgi:hypothetical protein